MRAVDRSVDGDADVRGLERGTVVDAIPQKSDDMAPGMKRADHAGFLRRGKLGENARRFGKLSQRFVTHLLDFGAKHDTVDFESNLAADLAGDDFIVTRKNS